MHTRIIRVYHKNLAFLRTGKTVLEYKNDLIRITYVTRFPGRFMCLRFNEQLKFFFWFVSWRSIIFQTKLLVSLLNSRRDNILNDTISAIKLDISSNSFRFSKHTESTVFVEVNYCF